MEEVRANNRHFSSLIIKQYADGEEVNIDYVYCVIKPFNWKNCFTQKFCYIFVARKQNKYKHLN